MAKRGYGREDLIEDELDEMIPLPPLDEDCLVASICRGSFEEFVHEFWETVPGSEPLQWNWHMGVLCEELQTVAERVFLGLPRLNDVICNISPGTSKSTIVSIMFPAWVWTRMPNARIMSASHTDSLVIDLASKSRFLIKSEKYKGIFPYIEFREDQDTKHYFANTRGGDRFTCTISGKSPMGFHGHIIIVDDPIDPKGATSIADLKTAQEFFDNVLPSRKVNKEVSVTFLVMQRLHESDPTGHLLNKGKKEGAAAIRHICLPAELPKGDDGAYTEGNVSPKELVKHYVDGLMDPMRLSRKVLNERKTDGMYSYSGQYLQSPVPLGGGAFKVIYFNKRLKAAPRDCKRVRFWDKAATDGGGCRTAGVLMGKDSDGQFYIEHIEKGQWEPIERNERILACALRDRAKYGPNHDPAIWVEREGGASGRGDWLYLARKLAGFRMREFNVARAGSKEIRANNLSCQLAAGGVSIVDDGTWDVNDFVSECCSFPRGTYKDQVDAASGAFLVMIGKSDPTPMRVYSIGKKRGMLKFVVCTRMDLPSITLEGHIALHIGINDLGGEIGETPFALESLPLHFANLDPKDYQDKWEVPIPGYGLKPSELAMSREQGKKLWSFLTRQRSVQPEVWTFSDEGDGRAMSVAMGVCDALRLKRSETIYNLNHPEDKCEGKAINQYIYEQVKATRGLVM